MLRLVSLLLWIHYLSPQFIQAQEQQCTANDDTCAATATSSPPTPTTATLPPDFIDPCRDTDTHCPMWSIQGECRSNEKYMNNVCPRSCGICQPLKLEGVDNVKGAMKDEEGRDVCRDEVLECGGWAGEGECMINPDYMRRDNCKYSCWVCVDPEKDRALGVDEETIAKKLLYYEMNLGRNQLIRQVTEGNDREDPMTLIAHNKVRTTIAEMEEYAKYTMTAPDIHMKARERCRNEFRMCAEWASRGYCYPAGHPNQPINDNDDAGMQSPQSKAKDVLYMKNMCPLACRMCEDIPSLACAGKRHPYARPVMEISGGVNSYFESLRSNEKSTFVSHPEIGKDGNEHDSYVVVLSDILSEKDIEALLFLGKAIGFSTNNTASCRDQRTCTMSQIEQDGIYKEIMERIAEIANTTIDYLEPMDIIRQSGESAEKGLTHNYQLSSVWKPAGPRVLSFHIILSNNNNSKEQLGFPHLDWLYIQPKKGSAVLWPNVVNEDLWELDPLTTYEYFGLGSDGVDEMFVASVHVRLHNWTDANYRGCA